MTIRSAFLEARMATSWAVVGVLFTVVFGGVGLYATFVQDHRPKLRYEIISNASVVDVREQVGNLDVLYDRIDIQDARLDLRVVVLRIVNDGSADILIAHYDPRDPVGIRVSSGRVMHAEVIRASNPYLEETLELEQASEQTTLFTPVILEFGEAFSVKLLILNDETETPRFEAVGKVAAVRVIPVQEALDFGATPFLTRAFGGDALVQVARLPAYFVGLIIAVPLIVGPASAIGADIGRWKRRKEANAYRRLRGPKSSVEEDLALHMYRQQGVLGLQVLAMLPSESTIMKRRSSRGGKQLFTGCFVFEESRRRMMVWGVPLKFFPEIRAVAARFLREQTSFSADDIDEILQSKRLGRAADHVLDFVQGGRFAFGDGRELEPDVERENNIESPPE